MILGSEGRLGVITEVTVQVHRVPAEAASSTPTSSRTGRRASPRCRRSRPATRTPTVTRVSDARETGFSLATAKESKGLSGLAQKGLMAFLKRRGWDLDELCLSFIGYEGEPDHVAHGSARRSSRS